MPRFQSAVVQGTPALAIPSNVRAPGADSAWTPAGGRAPLTFARRLSLSKCAVGVGARRLVAGHLAPLYMPQPAGGETSTAPVRHQYQYQCSPSLAPVQFQHSTSPGHLQHSTSARPAQCRTVQDHRQYQCKTSPVPLLHQSTSNSVPLQS